MKILMLLIFTILISPTFTFAQNGATETPEKSYERFMSVRHLVNHPAPQFSSIKFEGEGVFKINDVRGKIILLSIWNSNCLPCIKEMRSFVNMKNHFRSQNVLFFAMDPLDDREQIKAFLKSHHIDFKILYSPNHEFLSDYKITAYPVNYVIGQDGIVRYAEVGYNKNGYKIIDSVIRKNLSGDDAHPRN